MTEKVFFLFSFFQGSCLLPRLCTRASRGSDSYLSHNIGSHTVPFERSKNVLDRESSSSVAVSRDTESDRMLPTDYQLWLYQLYIMQLRTLGRQFIRTIAQRMGQSNGELGFVWKMTLTQGLFSNLRHALDNGCIWNDLIHITQVVISRSWSCTADVQTWSFPRLRRNSPAGDAGAASEVAENHTWTLFTNTWLSVFAQPEPL